MPGSSLPVLVPAPSEPSLAPETVGPFLADKLRAQKARLEETEPRVLAAGDADAIHDLRVALRRIRTILEVGRAVFGRFHADEVGRAFKAVQRATGALRDEEVLLELVAAREFGDDRPGVRQAVAAWIEVRKRRERRLRSSVRQVVRAGDLAHPIRLLEALLLFRIKPSREKRATKFARRAVDNAAREVARRSGAPSGDARALHRLRIEYKRLRYTVETFADAPGCDVAIATGQAASRFQSLLGRIHDADMAVDAVKRARALSPEDRAALLVALTAVRNSRAAAYEKAMATPSSVVLSAPSYASGTVSLRKTSTR